jgi:hypothetical protein
MAALSLEKHDKMRPIQIPGGWASPLLCMTAIAVAPNGLLLSSSPGRSNAMRKLVVLVALALVVIAAGSAAAQTVVPGCLQPDRGAVRLVPGIQACQPGEVGVALQLRRAPASLPPGPAADPKSAVPAPAARPDAAMAAFFGGDQALAGLGAPVSRASSSMAVPARRTLAVVGAGLTEIR